MHSILIVRRIAAACCLTLLALAPLSAVAADSKSSSPPAPAPGTAPARPVVKEVTVTEARKLVADTNVVVLDVRTPQEFAEGHLAGATNLNFHAPDFAKKLAGLDRSKTYLVHCAAGGRSAKTRDQMKLLKFDSILHLPEGYKGWEKAGQPVVK